MAARNAINKSEIRDIPRNDTSGTYHRPLTHCNPALQSCIGADACSLAHESRDIVFMKDLGVGKQVIGKHRVGTDECIILKRHSGPDRHPVLTTT